MTTWKPVAKRMEPNTAYWYMKARVLGVEVGHAAERYRTYTFDSTTGQLGAFRAIGSIAFLKNERRWRGVAKSDANAVDLSTLIAYACSYATKYGTHPGQGLRSKEWEHYTAPNGERRAGVGLCYRLTVEDLMTPASQKVSVPGSIATLADDVSVYYDELLSEARA